VGLQEGTLNIENNLKGKKVTKDFFIPMFKRKKKGFFFNFFIYIYRSISIFDKNSLLINEKCCTLQTN
jgi:hypothetical protein